MKKTPNVKYMTEDQLKRIIDNGYMGDPANGHGYDYGADLKDEIDRRLWELQDKKQEAKFERQQEEMRDYEDQNESE